MVVCVCVCVCVCGKAQIIVWFFHLSLLANCPLSDVIIAKTGLQLHRKETESSDECFVSHANFVIESVIFNTSCSSFSFFFQLNYSSERHRVSMHSWTSGWGVVALPYNLVSFC